MWSVQKVTSKEQKVTSYEQKSNERGAKSKTKKKKVTSKEEKVSLLFGQVMVADKTKQTKSTKILQCVSSKLRDYADHTNVELQTL